MDKKKILIVSRSFYPVIAPRSFRSTELAKEFAKQGHIVTVLTHKKNYDYGEFEKKYNIVIKDFVNGKWKDLHGSNSFIRLIRFCLNYFFLFPDIQLSIYLQNELKNYSGFDILISLAVPYPVHWGVALAKKNNSKLCNTWIADCGDPFMGNKEQKLNYPFYFHLVEKWFCKKPNYISIPIDEAIKAYPSLCRKKIRVIPQGFNFDENIIRIVPNNKIPTFAYAGALSKGFRDPSEFLNYLCSVELPFKFIVYTNSVNMVKPFKEKLGNKLEIRDLIPREHLLKELCRMDFLINFENKNNVQSPSKIIDYTLTNRPILSVKSSLLNTKVVNEFLNKDYTNQIKLENFEKYNIKNVVSQFLELSK